MVKSPQNIDLLEARLRSLSIWTVSDVLEKEYGVSGSFIRDLVRRLRREGIPIASGDKGYKVITADKYEEIIPTLEHLRSRAMSELITISKLERNFKIPRSQDGLFDDMRPQLEIARNEIEELLKSNN